jgi:hypothetical protein
MLSPTPIPAQNVFPQCLSVGQSQQKWETFNTQSEPAHTSAPSRMRG